MKSVFFVFLLIVSFRSNALEKGSPEKLTELIHAYYKASVCYEGKDAPKDGTRAGRDITSIMKNFNWTDLDIVSKTYEISEQNNYNFISCILPVGRFAPYSQTIGFIKNKLPGDKVASEYTVLESYVLKLISDFSEPFKEHVKLRKPLSQEYSVALSELRSLLYAKYDDNFGNIGEL